MAKMVANAFELESNPSSPFIFTDVSKGKWYFDFTKALYDNGVTVGETDTTFAPDEDVLRGQLAAFIYRTQLKTLPVDEDKDKGEKEGKDEVVVTPLPAGARWEIKLHQT